jgi:protein TonB
VTAPASSASAAASSGVAGIADAVLASGAARRSSRMYVGLGVALLLHAGGVLWARSLDAPPRARPRVPPPATEIDLEAPAVLPPAPPAPPPPEPQAPSAAKPPPSATHAPRAQSAPARAGAIVAQQPDPGAPVDFGDAFVTGAGTAYAGGVTTATGTSTRAVNSLPPAQPQPQLGAQKGRALSRPVALAGDQWHCPWPHEAEREQIDEQTVTLRVRVEDDGHARSVTLIEDPGYGFGAAARACAMLTRFSPALDAAGHPTEALSPPIRVRFTR